MKINRLMPLLTIIVLMLLGAGFFVYQQQTEVEKAAKPMVLSSHNERSCSVEGKTFKQKLTIAAIGDILIHDRVYEDARTAEGFDFKPMLAAVKDELEKPDLLLANQETILGGVEMGLSSYPSFNSPHEVGDALIDAGVDIVSTANNHTLDRGEKGAQNSISYLTAAGLPYVGSFKDEEDKKRLRILDKNGISIAYLSYTYGTNGIPVPEGKDYLVNLIDKAAMEEEVHRAKKEADVVVMSIHWGNEYQRHPDEIQKELAQFLVNEGVDVVFGHHPHVLQPMEWLTAEDGSKSLVVYSLGNFLSGQVWDYKDIGGMASVEVIKTVTPRGTSVELANPAFYPTFVASNGQRNYRVVPLKDAGSHGLKDAGAKYTEIAEHMKIED
ncbi:capsular biosynthesis protein [Mesobacillus campisalis]|uniref:Capsular biosynthesis protein n=1 Tax=Mesobacillus campisalis TaxID=1408103 RepID=A0A0M2SRU6_9BACI|nr:CapA family protein [Mesobacillus campisalis]KKK37309.1 capsular biosynthesis protein [Mesobacillus campisalis]